MKDAPSGYRPTIPDVVHKNITAFTPEQVYFVVRYACALFDGYEPPPPPDGTDPLLLKVVCGEMDERQAYIDGISRERANNGRKGGESKARRQRQANLANLANATFATSKEEERKEEKRIEDDFNRFWETYGKKSSRKEALRSFEKAAKSKTWPGIDVVLAKVAEWRKTDQWTKDGGQFQPHASTWLNQERWNDELPAKAQEPPNPLSRIDT